MKRDNTLKLLTAKKTLESSEQYKTLNTKQKEFFKCLFSGENVFLTGPAGVGKSFCIGVLFDVIGKTNLFVAKAALTGVAALNIGGQTIHSWAGLGLADEDIDSVVEKARNFKKARARIRHSDILFIDEISMGSADLLAKLDAVMKDARHCDEPFGGMQVVFSGDFLQLPPVFRGGGDKMKFAFQGRAWQEAGIKMIHLTKLMRQDENTPYAKMLQKVRFGKLHGVDALLRTRMGAKLNLKSPPIKVFCKNLDIDSFNMKEYARLSGPEKTYFCRDEGDHRFSQNLDRNCAAPPVLKLKVGARVLLLSNVSVDDGLVNGSVGTVKGFGVLGPQVEFDNGLVEEVEYNKWEMKEQELDVAGKMRYKVVASRSQIPLKLAWATSVHRLQGSTLDFADIDLSGAFEYGQHYVALSRVKTLEGITLSPFSARSIKAHPECVEFYSNH